MNQPWPMICSSPTLICLTLDQIRLRLRVGEGRSKSFRQFRQRAIFQLASRMWVDGVDWDESIRIAEKAFQDDDSPSKGTGKGKRTPKGKGRGKGKK